MKLRTLQIALALGVVLLSLMSSGSSVQAEPPQRFVADTGLILPGPHHKVRLTLTGFTGAEGLSRLQFRHMTYSPEVCSGGVCRSSVISNQTSGPVTLMPGEAASFDIPASIQDGTLVEHVGVRGMVLTNRRDVRVNVMIIDDASGDVVAAFEGLLELEG